MTPSTKEEIKITKENIKKNLDFRLRGSCSYGLAQSPWPTRRYAALYPGGGFDSFRTSMEKGPDQVNAGEPETSPPVR
jgi:hypothetical protein